MPPSSPVPVPTARCSPWPLIRLGKSTLAETSPNTTATPATASRASTATSFSSTQFFRPTPFTSPSSPSTANPTPWNIRPSSMTPLGSPYPPSQATAPSKLSPTQTPLPPLALTASVLIPLDPALRSKHCASVVGTSFHHTLKGVGKWFSRSVVPQIRLGCLLFFICIVSSHLSMCDDMADLKPSPWRTCRVLANMPRLKLLALCLRQPGLTVSASAARCAIRPPIASEYLRALEARGLLRVQRVSRWVHYYPGDSPIVRDLIAVLTRTLRHQDAQSLRLVFRLATAFTHPRRIEIYRALDSEPRNLTDIAKQSRIPINPVLRHLHKLQTRGFVRHSARRAKYSALVPRHAVARALSRLALAAA